MVQPYEIDIDNSGTSGINKDGLSTITVQPVNAPVTTTNVIPSVPALPPCTHNTWDLSLVPNETLVTISWRDCSGQPQVKTGLKSSIGNEFQADGSEFNIVYNPPLGTSVIIENPVDVVPVTPPIATTPSTTPSGTSVVTENPVDVIPVITTPPTTTPVTTTTEPTAGKSIITEPEIIEPIKPTIIMPLFPLISNGNTGGGEESMPNEIKAEMPNLLNYLGIMLGIVIVYKIVKK